MFPVPCRPALHADTYGEACCIHERRTGKRLSRQSWNIAGKIREVDGLLRSHSRAKRVIRETHPEVLFWALNAGKCMRHNKRTEDGFHERLRLLAGHYRHSKAIVDSVLNTFARKDVGRDDVLDALAAALAGKLGKGSLRSLPECPERDSTGVSMEIVYTACNLRAENWNSR